jgi:hypothetical protein
MAWRQLLVPAAPSQLGQHPLGTFHLSAEDSARGVAAAAAAVDVSAWRSSSADSADADSLADSPARATAGPTAGQPRILAPTVLPGGGGGGGEASGGAVAGAAVAAPAAGAPSSDGGELDALAAGLGAVTPCARTPVSTPASALPRGEQCRRPGEWRVGWFMTIHYCGRHRADRGGLPVCGSRWSSAAPTDSPRLLSPGGPRRRPPSICADLNGFPAPLTCCVSAAVSNSSAVASSRVRSRRAC